MCSSDLGKAESNDPPPEGPPPTTALVRSDRGLSAAGPDDMRRADDAEREETNPDYGQRAFDNFGYAGTSLEPYGEAPES